MDATIYVVWDKPNIICYAGGTQKSVQKIKGFFFDFLKKKDKNNDFLTKISVLNSFLGYFATLANLSRLNNTKIELSKSSNLVVPLFTKGL